jgi:hypothetical protein
MPDIQLRPMTPADKAEVAELIYCSINYWHRLHGRLKIFQGDPRIAEVFCDVYKGRTPVFLIPMEKEQLVRQAYDWGARVCEMHFCQVRGRFQPFQGVNMPTFLPETE